jgi:hypothetical protein
MTQYRGTWRAPKKWRRDVVTALPNFLLGTSHSPAMPPTFSEATKCDDQNGSINISEHVPRPLFSSG